MRSKFTETLSALAIASSALHATHAAPATDLKELISINDFKTIHLYGAIKTKSHTKGESIQDFDLSWDKSGGKIALNITSKKGQGGALRLQATKVTYDDKLYTEINTTTGTDGYFSSTAKIDRDCIDEIPIAIVSLLYVEKMNYIDAIECLSLCNEGSDSNGNLVIKTTAKSEADNFTTYGFNRKTGFLSAIHRQVVASGVRLKVDANYHDTKVINGVAVPGFISLKSQYGATTETLLEKEISIKKVSINQSLNPTEFINKIRPGTVVLNKITGQLYIANGLSEDPSELKMVDALEQLVDRAKQSWDK